MSAETRITLDAPDGATPDHGRRAIVHEHTLALVFHMLMGPRPDVLGAVELIASAEPLDLCSACEGHRGDDSGPCRECSATGHDEIRIDHDSWDLEPGAVIYVRPEDRPCHEKATASP